MTAMILAGLAMLLAGCQGQANYRLLSELVTNPDTDQDGLPDAMEAELGTALDQADSDGDGLSDYYEAQKYLTNPLSRDSDQDGIEDSAWDERREYAYTIQAIVDLRPPYSVEEMNDFYQDARIIGEPEYDVARVEVILYPEAKTILNPGRYDATALVETPYTAPTYTKNYSSAMQASVRALTRKSKTDLQAVVEILKKFRKFKSVRIMEDLGYQSSLPIQFNIYRDKDGTVVEKGMAETGRYSLDEIKERVLFADSMYQLGVHGACSSSASLRGAMLRAAALPERTILTIPLVYYYETDGTAVQLKEEYNMGLSNVTGRTISDHFFHEVYLGNQWVRVDYDVDTGVRVFGRKPCIKILTCHDQTDYDFTTYWNYDSWLDKRPYKYLSVIEQEPAYRD